MTRIALIAAAATASLTLTAPASFAGISGASLGACYNHVISACNQTSHPVPCSESGMDACDDLHSAKAGPGARGISLLPGGGRTPSRKFLLMPTPDSAAAIEIRR